MRAEQLSTRWRRAAIALAAWSLSGCSALTGFGDLVFETPVDAGERDARARESGRDVDEPPTDAGDAMVDAGDARMDAGDAAMDAGDAAAMDAGDAAMDAGDAAMDAGDAAMDAGDAGDASRDTGTRDALTDGSSMCTASSQCDDLDECTSNECVDGGCVHRALPNGSACSDDDECTQTECRDGLCAVVSRTTCTVDPTGPCDLGEVCVPATGDCTLVRLPPGASCDSGDPCDDAPVCTSGGACVSSTRCAMDDENECTSAVCQAGSCRHVPVPDDTACGMGGTLRCCSGRCVDRSSDAMHCSTCGNACSVGRRCLGGVCSMCSIDADCDDGLDCTVDRCASGSCTNTRSSTHCIIDGVCYAQNAPNPANACEHCAPMTNATMWTPRTGATCDDGLYCTTNDRCTAAGGCIGPSRSCPNNACNTGICLEEMDACGFIPRPDGTNCGIALECCSGTCVSVVGGC